MTVVFDKSELIKLEPEILEQWIQENCYTLVGSAIFTKNNSLGSKLVRWGEKHLFAKCKDDDCFVPSHTGSIIEYMNDLYIFDMKPPRASVQPLRDYLIETDEDYKLVLRDFKKTPLIFDMIILARPSVNFKTIFPEKPSVTTTSQTPIGISLGSTLPIKLYGYVFIN